MDTAEYAARHAELLATVRDLAVAGDWHGIIHACSGSNHSDITRLWALAMTAHYGPTGLHESRIGADGRPDPAKCTDCPRVFTAMREAEDKIRRTFGVALAGHAVRP